MKKVLRTILPNSLWNRMRRMRRDREWRHRLATADERVLPYFLVIGAMKSGSTSLFRYLYQHPDVVPCFTKEVDFFTDKNFHRGASWYRANMPRKNEMGPDQITGEATPGYIFNPLVPERIHQLVPNLKLIALLRDPTERAISHYFHQCRRKRETLPMLEAMKIEEERTHLHTPNQGFGTEGFSHFTYKRRGLYLEQIERYWALFPRGNLLIMSAEEMYRDVPATLKTVHHFLGIDPDFVPPDIDPHNVGKNRTEVDPGVRDYLNDFFQEPNKRLFEALGREFDW